MNLSTQEQSKQHHQMHQQLHHTLPQNQQQQQPLVSQANQQQQTMLQFHHQQQHPYSTLHHHHHHHQQSAASNNNNNNTLHHFSQNLSHLQQQQQQQKQQQQQYNMNSDYSSSTYHIYDQISDLMIISQQRKERKRQQEQRRKVILIILTILLLVGTSMFLIMQSIFPSSSSPDLQATARSSSSSSNNNNELPQQMSQPVDALSHPTYAPSIGQKPNNWFDSRFQSGMGIRLPTQIANSKVINQPIIPPTIEQQATIACSSHGSLIQSEQGVAFCKCDPGFWGERCEFSAAYQPSVNNQLLNRCLLTNCNGNGQCSAQGRCLCFAGWTGPNCELISVPAQTLSASNPQLADQQQVATNQQQIKTQVQLPHHHHHRCSSSLNNCNGNGHCNQQGKCKCLPGYSGEACQERELCFQQTCSNQGVCQPTTGQCQCKFGFKGTQCEIRDDEQLESLFNCSNHGKFDYNLRKCNCDLGYAGFDCSEERCELADGQQVLDCGLNGLFDCRHNKCICQDGYSGDLCQLQQCSAQCLRNGQCVDGNCVCQQGFYGKHCSLNGCPNQCSGRGQCVRMFEISSSNALINQQAHQPEWRCQCQPGSMGDDCSLLVERQCDDGLDNDRDGLVDCADSECCSDKVCQNSTLCMKSPDPLDILMRKQPPPPTSSFFQRMQFLIEKYSSQIYSNPKDFNDSITANRYVDRASVIRGRVTYLKQGITGVRVSVAGQMNLGITLSRDGGYFDLMVNGGGAAVLEFRREPFATAQKAVRVPWNEIVLMDPVELMLDSPNADVPSSQTQINSPLPEPDSPSCSAHNYRLMRPLIVAAPRTSRKSHSSSRAKSLMNQQTSRAVILRDSAMVQQSIILPGSSNRDINSNETSQSVSLIYISSRANEFMSTISLQLTPPADQSSQFKIPQELKLIHLKIIIEGNLFEQLFEPQANLSFTYAWNRRNVYRQKSFGLSTASVSVGYEYYDCKHVIWTNKHIQLPGHDLSISDVGSQWNLNIHYRYNYRDSILLRGDGQNFNLKTDKPLVVQPIMGDGYQRQASCPYCDGATTPIEQRLYKPQALASAPDGSIYVGDANLIRRIEWAPQSTKSSYAGSDRVVRTVLELPTSRVASKYSLALNLADQKLYMADPERHQIYLIREQNRHPDQATSLNETTANLPLSSSEDNLVPVVGSGLKCQLDDRSNCGDSQSARFARLIEPKAVAFDLNSRMYIADGPNVRMVDTDNKIYTILGDYGATRHTKFPCSGEAIPMHKFVPKAPLDLALSPIDDTLHLLDDNVVYKITQDKRVQLVAGRLAHCLASTQETKQSSKQLRATEVFLQSAQSIAFNQNGDLFISEDDQKQTISRVLLVSPDEDTIQLYAGLPIDAPQLKFGQSSASPNLLPTVDSLHVNSYGEVNLDKQRSSNILPLSQTTKATDWKFNSVAAIALDQQGKLIVADSAQLRILLVEPDLPQFNAATNEYELQSPDNGDELLIFNRYGHHTATREISSSQAQRNSNKYTFSYNINTSFGQLSSVSYSTGNKISIYRDGPQHSVKMIETAFGGQCKLDISRNGQVHSISTIAPNTTKTNFSYHVDGGLLKQSRDQASGELFDFSYDEFGRAISIQHSSPKLGAPVDCRLSANLRNQASSYLSQHCSALIVAE